MILNSVKRHREHQSISQEQLGATLGVSRQTVIVIEKGNHEPSRRFGRSGALYFAMSFVGEGKNQDDREVTHKNIANRAGVIAGNVIFSLAIVYQLSI